MPNAPLRPCRHPGCPQLITSGYCEQHRRHSCKTVYDQTKRKDDSALANAARIRNSARWRRFRDWFRRRNPLCCDPFADHGPLEPTQQVHHVIGLTVQPALAFTESNCRPLCTRCHARIERMERNGDATQSLFATEAAR